MSEDGEDWIPMLTMVSAGVGVLTAVALTALQSDLISRRIMAPDALQDKRHVEYIYRWNQALEKAKLQFKFFFAGMNDETHANEEEMVYTTLIEAENELKEFVEKLVEKKDRPVRIGRIGTDSKLNKNNELFVWLYRGAGTIYQVPLRAFGTLLADAMDRKITKTTFCFASDASAGWGSQLVVDLVQATKSADVFVVQEPLWMVYFAVVAQQHTVATTVMERILFALCRLEALRATNNESTVLMTIPGQATTSILLPLLQTVFPDDRHVFSYTGCVKTVEYATVRRKAYPRARVPTSMDEALRFTNPICHTTPLNLCLYKSANVMKPYVQAMTNLPLSHADTVEAWMGSVDAFLNLKREEKVNGYLPYVLKLDYLISLGSLQPKSDRYWCLLSLLQYIMGSRTRAIPTEQVDAAISWLGDYTVSASTLSGPERKAIQNAVFQHKLILIENKTLLDTVQPTQHWTLKAALKAGCSCCAPDDDDEENDPKDMGALTSKLEAFGRKPKKAAPTNGGYVDGKASFAFDPTRFTGMM